MFNTSMVEFFYALITFSVIYNCCLYIFLTGEHANAVPKKRMYVLFLPECTPNNYL